MTRRRSLKRRIRARMARTGESYTTARRHVINRLEAESGPAGDHPGSPAGVEPRRRPIWIAAVGLALVGAAIAAVIVVAGGGGSKDTAGRYAGFEVPCSEMLRPAQLAIDHPVHCFRPPPGRGPRVVGGAMALAAMQRVCGGAHPDPPKGPCAFDLPGEQGALLQVARPSGRG
jgi:hypothetical protein